jgi:hypothetical protein
VAERKDWLQGKGCLTRKYRKASNRKGLPNPKGSVQRLGEVHGRQRKNSLSTVRKHVRGRSRFLLLKPAGFDRDQSLGGYDEISRSLARVVSLGDLGS